LRGPSAGDQRSSRCTTCPTDIRVTAEPSRTRRLPSEERSRNSTAPSAMMLPSSEVVAHRSVKPPPPTPRMRPAERNVPRPRQEVRRDDREVATDAEQKDRPIGPAQQERDVGRLGHGGGQEEAPILPPLLEVLRHNPEVCKCGDEREGRRCVQDRPWALDGEISRGRHRCRIVPSSRRAAGSRGR
jgi:hypothetical protein